MKINLGKTELIHFVGIGGIGMSGLAQIMKNILDMKPPIKPSIVLLGLSLGRNEFLPKFFPIIYAPVSKTAILKITANRNILDPVTN